MDYPAFGTCLICGFHTQVWNLRYGRSSRSYLCHTCYNHLIAEELPFASKAAVEAAAEQNLPNVNEAAHKGDLDRVTAKIRETERQLSSPRLRASAAFRSIAGIPGHPHVLAMRASLAQLRKEEALLRDEWHKDYAARMEGWKTAVAEKRLAMLLIELGIPDLNRRFSEHSKHAQQLIDREHANDTARLLGNLPRLAALHQRFLRRKRDYRRGNALDNYVRKNLLRTICSVFGDVCARCGSTNGLVLDHLWLPKNEGANFVMMYRDTNVLVSNVAPLCHSCNSGKSDRSVESAFTPEQLSSIGESQVQLSLAFLGNADLCEVARKWYRSKRVATADEMLALVG